jgi:hypothetical protein
VTTKRLMVENQPTLDDVMTPRPLVDKKGDVELRGKAKKAEHRETI